MLRPVLVTLAVWGVVLSAAAPAAAQTKLLRFPDIHGDRVVFTYAGDLWTASTGGGLATRLTAHPGLELFPRFSPDGSRIAFTGQYDGDEQVYVIPASGGVPQQLTYYPARGPLAPRWGYDNQVYDWSPDGRAVLFRSLRYSTDLSDSRLFLASVDGGLPVPLAMPESGAGDLSPDGSRVVYSPLFRDFRTWKRYEGGWAQELYIFDRETHVVERITSHRRADRDPMWIGDAVYFTSDRDGTLNLYRYDVGSRETTQLTDSDTWDVRWPGDDGANRIVYELNGELQVYTIDAGTSRPIAVTVPDDGLATRPSRVAAGGLIEDAELSPGGERALFVARGDVFTAPIENGPTRNLTRSSSAHDKWARWSPDGRRIAYVSDATGEDEIYLIAQDGSGEPEQLTTGGQAMRYAPEWSPDGERLAFGDKDGKLYVLEVDTREVIDVADEARGGLRDYVWSPRGGYLAFSMTDPTEFSSIWVWSLADRELHRITEDLFHEWNPAWDPDGDFLYYLSDRQFAPQLGSFEWNYLVDRETGIYALALRKDVPHPLPPESDEVALAEEDDDDEDGTGAGGSSADGASGDGGDDADGGGRRGRPHRHRLRRAFAARRAPAGHVRQLRRAERGGRRRLLHPWGRTVLRPGRRRAAGAAALHLRGPRDHDHRRRDQRLRRVARSREGARARGGRLERLSRGRRRRHGSLDARAEGRPGAGRGVGADLRRGLAALPRLLLRRQHARVRLGGASRPVSSAPGARRPPLGPELRDRRDGRGAERQPRLHRGRRLGDAPNERGWRCPVRSSSSTRRRAATASRRSSPATTRSRATGRRSPRSASTRGSATTYWR